MIPRPSASAPAAELRASRAARIRYWHARRALDESRREFELAPSVGTATQVRLAETALEDAIAVAGELQVPGVPWTLP